MLVPRMPGVTSGGLAVNEYGNYAPTNRPGATEGKFGICC